MTDEKTGSEKEKNEDCCGGGGCGCGCHGHGGRRLGRCCGICLGIAIGLILACVLGAACRMWMGCRYAGMSYCPPAQTQMAPVQK